MSVLNKLFNVWGKAITFLFLFELLFVSSLDAQRGDIRVMFYNLENLFDTIDNPETNDEEFLPKGDKKWDSYRYWNKINKTFQVIAAVGGKRLPEIVGCCEIESYAPLRHLVMNTPLSKYPYTIIHKDSPDSRGIDVALMYQPDKVQLLSKEYITVRFLSDTAKKTRDILFARFKTPHDDTLNIFFNHWPSRRGGQQYSERFRVQVAKIEQQKLDSIQSANAGAKILIMGDFNDEPQNKSLGVLESAGMHNLSKSLQEKCKCGTYRYKSKWNMLDQVLVSPMLLEGKGLKTSPADLKIYKGRFLLENEDTYGGQKPYRTYLGPRYVGGFSDHLPIYIDLFY
jgi:hypothetical protein